jgi:hypothetical protein
MIDDMGIFRTTIGIANFALISAGGRSAPTIVVFAEPGDMVLLGAFGLEGLNLRIDLARKELVPAGPVPVAVAA